MTAKEAIDRIADMLNLKFTKESFATTKLVEGDVEVTNNLDEEFKIGQELFVVNESTLSPAPQGRHETREGLILVVDENSVIIAMEQKATEAPANEGGEAEAEVTVEEGMEETVEVEVPEEAADVMSEDVVQAVVEALTPVVEEIKSLQEEMKKMKEKMEMQMSALNADFQSFKKSPEKFSVIEKRTYKDSVDDFKLEIIKSLKK